MNVEYRMAQSVDVPAMARSRATDIDAGPADPRMAAYLDGTHHPQQARAPRVAYVATSDNEIVGYIAGHATRRYDCGGELQYLYVSPAFRRQGVAVALLQLLAKWFAAQHITRVCVDADIDSDGAVPFYTRLGARPINPFWYVWDDIGVVLGAAPPNGAANG